MNDRFKFRVWDKRRKCYINPPEPTPLLQADGLLAYFTNHPEYMEIYNVQFCTGLKDKNGILIYEGDIVQGTCGVYWGNLIVYFNEQRATFYLDRCDKEYKELRFHSKNQEDNFYLEVIGNIYENPELL